MAQRVKQLPQESDSMDPVLALGKQKQTFLYEFKASSRTVKASQRNSVSIYMHITSSNKHVVGTEKSFQEDLFH